MTDESKEIVRKRKKRMIVAALLGAALALACKALPAEYQGPCEILVHLCSGGF